MQFLAQLMPTLLKNYKKGVSMKLGFHRIARIAHKTYFIGLAFTVIVIAICLFLPLDHFNWFRENIQNLTFSFLAGILIELLFMAAEFNIFMERSKSFAYPNPDKLHPKIYNLLENKLEEFKQFVSELEEEGHLDIKGPSEFKEFYFNMIRIFEGNGFYSTSLPYNWFLWSEPDCLNKNREFILSSGKGWHRIFFIRSLSELESSDGEAYKIIVEHLRAGIKVSVAVTIDVPDDLCEIFAVEQSGTIAWKVRVDELGKSLRGANMYFKLAKINNYVAKFTRLAALPTTFEVTYDETLKRLRGHKILDSSSLTKSVEAPLKSFE